MDQRDQRHELQKPIDLVLDQPEPIHYAPPHGKHVEVTLLPATLHQLERLPQRLLQQIQRLSRRRETPQARRFQLLQQVSNHPHVARQPVAVPPVRGGVSGRCHGEVDQAHGVDAGSLGYARHEDPRRGRE